MLPSGWFLFLLKIPVSFLSLSPVQVKLLSGHWWSWLSKDT